jgi:hypothetical protein
MAAQVLRENGTLPPGVESTPLMLPWAAPSFLAVKGIAHQMVVETVAGNDYESYCRE